MNEVIERQGYLGMFDENALMMQSPYIHNDVLVFGNNLVHLPRKRCQSANLLQETEKDYSS